MYIAVQVVPGAKVESVAIIGTNIYGHTVYKVKTTQRPTNNAANKDVHRIIAEYLGLPLRQIQLVGGHMSREKLFHIIYR